MVFQKSASQLMELDKYSDQIQDLIQKHLLRYLYRPIIDVSRKRNLGYFSYVKGYNTPFSNYTEMSKYAAMSGKTRELFATVARNILAKFDSEKPTDNARLFFHASLYDIDHMVEILPQIPALAHIRLVLVFDEQEVNENSNQLELLDSVFKKIHGMHIELALLMKDKGLLLDPHFYNNFDFFIVIISLIPGNSAFSALRAIRTLRIFRTTRLFGRIKNLRLIVGAMLHSLPKLGWLFLILAIFYYIFAVLSTSLFSEIAPKQFGSLWASFYSLFSIMTMEGWQDTIDAVNSPCARWIFIPFMLLTSYIFLNLVVGIIVAAMEEIVKQEKLEKLEQEGQIEQEESSESLQVILKRLDALQAQLDRIEKKNNNENKE
jgi:hypothetical protein